MRRTARGTRPITRDPDGTRKALIASAVALFEHRGYAATSVQSIVDDAGLTKGAFYHHFDSKDDLLLEVHDEFIDHQLERARDVLARDIPVDQQLRALVTEALFEPLSLYKSEISVFIQERRFLPDEVFAEIKDKRDAYERCVIDVVERGMADGTFRAVGPARLVAFGVIGMSAWAYTWLDAEGPRSPTEIGDMYGKILVDGLMAGAPAASANGAANHA
jgi:TetR/AcrR family transcriptional regulator, cholesterol catabolism regulator